MSKNTYLVKNLVAIGASAGGLDPLQKIIKALPDKLPNTAIVIAQHTSPNYESMLAGLLQKNTNLTVLEAEHNKYVKSNHIFTCPPNTDVRIVHGKFEFTKPGLVGPKPSVDKLFTSVAKAFKENAIAVVISGTGNDGSKGIIDIKQVGGFTIAQDSGSSGYSGMPDSAVLTDFVDAVLDPEQIGQEIPKLLDVDYRTKYLEDKSKEEPIIEDIGSVKKILQLLHEKSGADFSGYKISTIHRRLEKRIHDMKFVEVEDYLSFVQDDPKELDELFFYLLIGVTQFYRNPDSMKALEESIRLSLMEQPMNESYRVWVPGCATGEEAYTISMILLKLFDEGSPKPHQIQIFATDIDQTPLARARSGKYPESSLKSLPKYYKDRFFTQNDDEYVVSAEAKKQVLFSKHDLTKNPPFLRLNLVSCRNLMIYFKTSLQNQIIPLFHYTLNANGVLFLGKSETIGRFKNLFETENLKHKIYRRRQADAGVSHIPLLQPMIKPTKARTSKNAMTEVMSVTDMVKETLYNGYEFPYIVVDDVLNIIEINKDVSFFLSLQHGAANLNATKLIHKDFRLDLRTLVSSAHTALAMVRGEYRRIKRDDVMKVARLKVQPTLYSKPNSPYFIITFEIADEAEHVPIIQQSENGDNNPFIAELEHELASTKEHLNTLVEELETSNEELQSLNEELQSSNEELQASNEEMETSNEELQATNEELNVAYNELRTATHKIERQSKSLTESQNNLKSLLDNTQQAFILIGKDYNVLHFNNHAFNLYKEIFNIRLTEGIIYIDILPTDYLKPFHEKFKEALKGKQSQFEQEIIDNRGRRRYLALNYTPVESEDNKYIESVSLSFIDITQKRNYEMELEKSYALAESGRALWRNVFEDSPELIAIFSGEDYKISFANKSYKSLFPNRRLTGRRIQDAIPEVVEQGFVKIMDKVRKSGKPVHVKEAPFTFDFSDSDEEGTRFFNYTYRSIYERGEDQPSVILHAIDITHQIEKRVEIEEEKVFMRLISESVPEHVWVLLPNRKIEFMNSSGLSFYGLESIDTLSALEKRVHPEDIDEFRLNMDTALTKMDKFKQDLRILSSGDEWCWHLFQASPMVNNKGTLTKLIVSSTDINEQMVSQKNKDDFMGVASHELKTPLTSVKAYTQLLQGHLSTSDDDLVKSFLEKSASSIDKLEKFISDLLDVSRVQSGKLTLSKKQMCVNNLVQNVVENLQVTTTNHKIIFDGKSTEILIMADEARIEQVLVNLINNAVKYSPDADEVIVQITKKIENIEISVQDFGVGINKKDSEHIFVRFYRVSEHQNKISGLGIGLNISKEIVSLHHGELWVESMPKKGSIFYFSIPIKDKHDEKNTTV